MIDIRLKDLLLEANKVNRFIEQNRDVRDALRFRAVMDHFTTLMADYLFTQRRIHEELKDDEELTDEQRKQYYEERVLALRNADITHAHEAVQAHKLHTPISIDVLNALIRLGVIRE